MKLVECIPNFSEGRRLEVVEAIAQAIASVSSVVILDRNSDEDHNRSVITFVGSPEGVEEAAFRGIAKAAELIDMEQHTGEHPRIGAADVVPFVPISEVTMADCVQMARRLGKRVGEALGIPVYLYEEAAMRPERKNLANIRRGEYEGLKAEIGADPKRDPDFGPVRLSSAGATVIGARSPLIAFNVYLTTPEVNIAKKIARAVRHSSGGLRYVKAVGLLVDGLAQVSMNLTNYQKTPIHRVVEFIRREAQRYGVAIHHSELVGLIPQAALVDSAQWYLQLDQFQPDQVLEQRLERALKECESGGQGPQAQDFLEALAQGTATPGGGSAAAFTAAEAAALVAMVGRLTLGKKKYAAVAEKMQALVEQAESLRSLLGEAVERDAEAYRKVMAAYRMPAEAGEARSQAIQRALLHASQVPLEVCQKAAETLELAVTVTAEGNRNAITDAGVAALLARAALTGAGLNVRVNAADLADRSIAAGLLQKVDALEERANKLMDDIRRLLKERGKVSH